MKVVPALRRAGRVATVLSGATSDGAFGFRTHTVDGLDLTFEGIAGDRHGGFTRRSGGREPWYPRGTSMRNERQVSILGVEDLAAIATDLKIDRLEPGWIGGNLVLEGLPDLSMIPPRTRLFFAGGVTLAVDGQNAPCRFSGRSIAVEHRGRDDLDLAFVRAAKRRRGLVAWVEIPGRIVAGEAVEARIPEQWIYTRNGVA
jgi:hypothetical protein